MNDAELQAPSLDEIRSTHEKLSPYVVRTPVLKAAKPICDELFEQDCQINIKLELFQVTGTFKARAALNTALASRDAAIKNGITAVSAGNHAIAAAFAAKMIGADAKLVMQSSANPARIAAAKAFGAEVELADDGPTAFARVQEIQETEGRVFIHPFEGKPVTEGAAGVGLEFIEDAGPLDVVIVAIGGGGLASGVACAVKALLPNCEVLGVEPEGAAAMNKSFDLGEPQTLDKVSTIADSLGPPMSTPYAYAQCRRFLDGLITVSDDDLAVASLIMFERFKLAVEPACAAALAASLGPYREKIAGKRAGFIACGANINPEGHAQLMAQGAETRRKRNKNFHI